MVLTTRFNNAPWANMPQDIVIGGVGGIGSWVALSLSRIGHRLYLYDMDTVEEHNLGGQCYRVEDITRPKVLSVGRVVEEFSGKTVSTFYSRYREESSTTNIMISAFDNMEARRIMFDNWKSLDTRELFIDGRMTAESFEVFAVQKGMEDKYEEYMFNSSEAASLSCSFKSTTHNAMGIAYVITGVLNNFLAQEKEAIRSVPFHTKFNIAMFMFTTKNN